MQDHMEVRPHMGFFFARETKHIEGGIDLCGFYFMWLRPRFVLFRCFSAGETQIWSSHSLLHSAPIFRLLLKVAVNRTHQCDFLTFHSRPRGAVGIAALLCR